MKKTTRKHFLYGLIITLLAAGSDPVLSQQTTQKTLTLAIPIPLSEAATQRLLANPKVLQLARLKTMLRDLGYGLKLKFYPGRRSLVEANSGNIDGILAREIITPEQYKNLVCASYYETVTPALYGLKKHAEQQTAPVFVKSIATPRGTGFTALTLPDSLAQTEIMKTNGHIQSVRLVVAGRAEAALMVPSLFDYIRRKAPHELGQLARLKPELNPMPAYTFLHKKHIDLIDRLDQQMAFTNVGHQQLPCSADQQQYRHRASQPTAIPESPSKQKAR